MCVTMITLIIINKQLEFSETSCHSFCNALESKKKSESLTRKPLIFFCIFICVKKPAVRISKFLICYHVNRNTTLQLEYSRQYCVTSIDRGEEGKEFSRVSL